MAGLIRTRVSSFRIEEGFTLSEVEEMRDRDTLSEHIIPCLLYTSESGRGLYRFLSWTLYLYCGTVSRETGNTIIRTGTGKVFFFEICG